MLRNILNALFIVCVFLFSPFFSFTQNAYVPYGQTNGEKGVWVINTFTNTYVTRIITPFDGYPVGVVPSPDGSKVYISYFGQNHVITEIDTHTNTITNNFILSTSGQGGDGIDISPDGSVLYYAGGSSFSNTDSLFMVNALNGQVLARIALPGRGPGGVAVSPDGHHVYVAMYQKVAVVDADTRTVTDSVEVGNDVELFGLAISPDGANLYVSEDIYKQIVVISTASKTITTKITTSTRTGFEPIGVAVSPDGTRVYAANRASGKFAVIDATTNTLIDTIACGGRPWSLAVTPDGTGLYISNNDAVIAASTADNSIVATIPTTAGATSDPLGRFVTGPTVQVLAGRYEANSSISGDFFNPLQAAGGGLLAQVNPKNNNLGSTNWGVEVYAGADHRNAYGWFGQGAKEYGVFLNRNMYVIPSLQPATDNHVRLYASNADIQHFIQSFNALYGTSKTIDDIRVVKYNGSQVDLDWSNNDDNSADYISIKPTSLGSYGFTNSYRYFEFPVSSYSEFWIVLTSSSAALPLQLTDFYGEKQGNGALLRWKTLFEQQTSHFDIERSSDGLHFTKISTLPAAGSSSSVRHYRITDVNPDLPTSFYRLKLVDQDGTFSYSAVISLKFAYHEGLTVYPNPVQTQLHIQYDGRLDKAGDVKIFDVQGNLVKRIAMPVSFSNFGMSIDVTNLQTGTYFLIIGNMKVSFIKS